MSPTPMKIALMSSQKDWGGGEQYLWSLGQGLIERGHKVMWVSPPESVLSGKILRADYDLVELAGRTPRPNTMLRLRHAMSKRGTQILHANDSHAILWGSLSTIASSKLKRIGMKHTMFPVRSAIKYNWFVDRLVCVSNAVRQLCLDSGIAAPKLDLIPGGIEPPVYDRFVERSNACRALNLDPGVPLISAVGGLIACKGYDTLIEAARHLRLRIPEFCIVVCGEGPMRGNLEHQIRMYGLERHIRLIGFQSDPTAWIAASDVFVHPSRSEGLSLVAIAAQMVSTPVVASEVGGLREIMRSSETSRPLGWIFGSSSAEDLARLLEQSLSNVARRREFAREAYVSATTRFNLRLMIDRFEEMYAEQLGIDLGRVYRNRSMAA